MLVNSNMRPWELVKELRGWLRELDKGLQRLVKGFPALRLSGSFGPHSISLTYWVAKEKEGPYLFALDLPSLSY